MLDLLAFAVLLVSLAAGLWLLYRWLPREGVNDDIVCVACGAPAAELVSFVCTGCQRDVREKGLAPRRAKPLTGTFWRVLIFSLLMVILSMVLFVILSSVFPVDVSYSGTALLRPANEAYASIALQVQARGQKSRAPHGLVSAELFMLDGRSVMLEVDYPQSRGRIIGANGELVLTEAPFNENLILRLMEEAALDVSDPATRHQARELFRQILEELRMPAPRSAADSAFSWSRTGRGSSHVPSRNAIRIAVVVGSVAWLAGVLWILSRKRNIRAITSRQPLSSAPRAEVI